MATNRRRKDNSQLSCICTQPATPASNDPCLYGQRPGVALTDEDSAGYTTVEFDGVFFLTVEAVDGAGNSAVVGGDILYYDAAATIKINKDGTNGVRYGYAGDGQGGTLVAAGANGLIPVTIGY